MVDIDEKKVEEKDMDVPIHTIGLENVGLTTHSIHRWMDRGQKNTPIQNAIERGVPVHLPNRKGEGLLDPQTNSIVVIRMDKEYRHKQKNNNTDLDFKKYIVATVLDNDWDGVEYEILNNADKIIKK